ncbi:hypothetical protein ALC60_11637 [Trachymyrmex zeteki]|uniref:Mutator-like transposase domain-containing protein n=1 Tax=Mycetomoellerius zeteki TaxID=64791 RepID=A0A151WNP0_9HYME|nr:hypothetical protein ALC60_11637 [Trachymyrmex zeteki]
MHSGSGSTGLNKILACADIPSFSNDLYKRYEKMIGSVIESEATDSCKRAALEERKLVIENIKNLCEQFLIFSHTCVYRPQDIATDIYPHLGIINSSAQIESSEFDKNLGEIVNIIISYDTGWSKRRNGRSYDSLNGYSTIIGFLSGKILDYTTRNRKCLKCELGHKKEDHDCRMNFRGSAKAMEADAGVQLINHSNVLQEVGLQVRVIIGDEDSSMIAAKLAIQIKRIPDHVFGNHENCEDWCKPKEKHAVNLSDQTLYQELVQFFGKYAANAHKFSISASNQANESFNNIVTNKAHKNKCLSRSAACDFRVANSVCVKNDGESSILNVQEKLRLENLRKVTEKAEGTTYKSNCGIDEAMNNINININKDSGEMLNIANNIVYFDLETTGLSNDADILQIAAICNNKIFNVYIKSLKQISTGASTVTKLCYINSKLYLRDKEVETFTIVNALELFKQFLDSLSKTKKCLLVAHNASFDA